jgi:hypothetical protein
LLGITRISDALTSNIPESSTPVAMAESVKVSFDDGSHQVEEVREVRAESPYCAD